MTIIRVVVVDVVANVVVNGWYVGAVTTRLLLTILTVLSSSANQFGPSSTSATTSTRRLARRLTAVVRAMHVRAVRTGRVGADNTTRWSAAVVQVLAVATVAICCHLLRLFAAFYIIKS